MGLLWAREDSNGFLVSGKAPWQLLFSAVPQPRLLPRHNIAGIEEGRQTSAGPPTSTRDQSIANHGTHTGMYYGWLEG